MIHTLQATGAHVVIPPRSHRIVPRSYDRDAYRTRNPTERFFSRINHFRHITTRYDKAAYNFLGGIHLLASVIEMI